MCGQDVPGVLKKKLAPMFQRATLKNWERPGDEAR